MTSVHTNLNYHNHEEYNEEIAQNIIHLLDKEIKGKVKELIERNKNYKKNPRMILDVLKKGFAKLLTSTYRKHRCQFRKTILLKEYKNMILNDIIKDNKYLNILLMKSPSRDISGINQITILTSP